MVDTRTGHYHYTRDKSLLRARIRRIEGQAKGVQRMIEEDRYCVDVIHQLSAISAATDKLSLIIFSEHIEGCIADSIREQDGERCIKEVMATLQEVIKRKIK